MMRPCFSSPAMAQRSSSETPWITLPSSIKSHPRSGRRGCRGGSFVLHNRAGWARTHVTKAGLLEAPRREFFRITERGRSALASNEKINLRYLRQFPEFIAFMNGGSTDGGPPSGQQPTDTSPTPRPESTPDELIESGYGRHSAALAEELQEKLQTCSPSFFERVVVELLVKMGYGGSLSDAGSAIGRTGDEGIDGVIKEDKLGLDTIYVQAKRWQATVGRPQIQQFAGALHGQHARKGVFLTHYFDFQPRCP